MSDVTYLKITGPIDLRMEIIDTHNPAKFFQACVDLMQLAEKTKLSREGRVEELHELSTQPALKVEVIDADAVGKLFEAVNKLQGTIKRPEALPRNLELAQSA